MPPLVCRKPGVAMGLASHINVYNTCLHILRNRGFSLEVRGEREADGGFPGRCFWIAKKDGFYFCGDNPIELLGLVGVHDYVKPAADTPYWWRLSGGDVWLELLEQAFPEQKPGSQAEDNG